MELGNTKDPKDHEYHSKYLDRIYTSWLLVGPAINLDRYVINHHPLSSEASGHVPDSIAGQLSMHQAIIELADSLRQEAHKKHLMEQW